jgi:hypothetical protein
VASNAAERTEENVRYEIHWYSSRKARNRNLYHGIKALQVLAAALVPVLTNLLDERTAWMISALAVFVVVAEGLQQLGRFQQNWVRYSLAGEALKREYRLYESRAGDYSDIRNPYKLLAERLEQVLQADASSWLMDLQSDDGRDASAHGDEGK